VLKKNHDEFVHKLKQKIQEYMCAYAFEKAKNLHAYVENVQMIFDTIETHFSEKKFATDIFVATTPVSYKSTSTADIALQLKHFLELPHLVSTIDCFDVSHFQSRYIVGACVRFTNGIPEKNKFRRFKIKTLQEQNDYAALQEIVSRRYKDQSDIPDLILIDGGKGQLHAIQNILPAAPIASLAKREEILYSPQFLEGKQLDIKTEVGKLLIALRDYAHHFAISYHRLRAQKQE
jgi:excinuclease ABC subunit C